MHSDQDGTATKQSQAVYDFRIRRLLFTTSLLSWLGLFAAALNNEYTGKNLRIPVSLKGASLLRLSQFLLSLHWKDSPAKTYNAGLRGSLLSVLIIASKLLARNVDSAEPFFALSLNSLQLSVSILLAIVQVLIPRRPDVFTPDGQPVDLERTSSAFHRFSMHWCTTALDLAGRPVAIDGLPVLNYLTRSKSQPLIALTSPKAAVWDYILAERFLGFAKQWILMFIRSILTFFSPYCVMRLLKSLEESGGRTDDAWIWLIGIGVSSTCLNVLSYHLIWIQWSEMAIPVRAQLTMAIFQKALRRKDAKDQKKDSNSKAASHRPDAVNILTSDTIALSQFTAMNYIIPSSFARFFFAMLFLLRLLGWQSTLVGLFFTALSVPIHTYLIKQHKATGKYLTAARDKKTKAITEALHALRQIKFSALEDQWEEYIETFRQEEIKQLRRSLTAKNIRSAWSIIAPFIVTASSIIAYAYFHGTITPSVIFPMIQVLPWLEGTLGFVPLVFLNYFGARTNASRIDEFLRRPEQKQILTPSPSGSVSFQDASFAWPSDEANVESSQEKQATSLRRFSLRGVNLEFPTGELSVISGKTGSGKSLLLAAIIGEVDLLGGRINAPSRAEGHSVAFVSQSPWLQNATFKHNILFGSSFDKERYEKVLRACALLPDLAALPKGDETQIGLRGVKLSGGQRARLAFGRALYSNAQLLVLDDIFSALDSHVCKAIFTSLTGELGEGRTRILVTHQVSLCLPKTKYVVRIENNTISYAGNTESIEGGLDIVEAETNVPQREDEEKPEEDPQDTKPTTKPTAKKAKSLQARTDMKVYRSYFMAAGGLGFFLIYLLGLVSMQVLDALTKWLLGRINSTRHLKGVIVQQENTNGNNASLQYFYLYLSSSLLAIILKFLFNLHTFSGAVRATKALFLEMTSTIFRMPLQWLDSNPIGDMLKKFTIDTRQVDEVLVNISEFADCFVKLMIVIAFGLYASMYTSFLTVALLLWCTQITSGYLNARSMVKRADAVPTADILEHFTSSAAGISTIRAFGAVEESIEQMHKHVDRLSTARRHFWIFNRWVGLQLSFSGILFTLGTGIVLLLSKSVIDTSLVGFSLTFSMGFSSAIFKAVDKFGALETFMDATGAVIEYTKLKTEDHGGNEAPKDWPSKGEVEVKRLNVAYSTDLPLVLKDVSFTVKAGTRIGIVGRTGAGKSSLTLSLLRLLEPRNGSILIDGIDISTIKLQALRSRIAFIPQDPVLFSGTVRSNLDYFKQIPEEKLNEAIRRVNLLGDEKAGLFTLDSPISAGGTNMSQGQRQLLCLARILIKNPKIIILDEATSAVDNKTDLLIQDTIRTEFSGTLIVVAHRLRTIAPFDQVMVMSDGKVAEIGPPAQILEDKGLFFDLVQDSQDREFLMGTIRTASHSV
ncbi:ABC multidrug transporter [Stipitochalara longipes BDJ]|nr:ABC multidrug transporter [Stipitochalara longipes BDJ]